MELCLTRHHEGTDEDLEGGRRQHRRSITQYPSDEEEKQNISDEEEMAGYPLGHDAPSYCASEEFSTSKSSLKTPVQLFNDEQTPEMFPDDSGPLPIQVHASKGKPAEKVRLSTKSVLSLKVKSRRKAGESRRSTLLQKLPGIATPGASPIEVHGISPGGISNSVFSSGRTNVGKDATNTIENTPPQVKRWNPGLQMQHAVAYWHQPGAIHVEDAGYRLFGRNRRLSWVSLGSSTSSIRSDSGRNGLLIQAQLASERILAKATPDPWWRRHQWWLAGATAVAIVGIVFAVVLVIVGFRGSHSYLEGNATMAPTSSTDVIEAQTSELIVSVIPSSAVLLKDESTPQYQALQWIVQQRLDNDDKYYTDARVLQHYSLAALFLGMSGGSTTWLKSNGWLDSATPCDWYGVDCLTSTSLQEDIIVGLYLSGRGLRGTLVPDASILGKTLRVLDLSHNELYGSLPEEFGQMKLITQLSLADNNLSGSIPSSLASMTYLAYLDMSNNLFGSTIPPEFGTLTALEQLRLDANHIIGEVPATIGSLNRLVHLDVSKNRLTFPIPTELGRLLNLKTLVAHSNSLLGPLPTEIGLLSSLETLTLSNNFIFNSIPVQIGDLSNLKSLDVAHNLFSGQIPSAIASLHQLSILRLQGNFLESVIPTGMQNLDELMVLDLSSNFLKGRLPSRLWSLPNLRNLNVSRNTFDSGGNSLEWSSPHLQVLDLSHNHFGLGGFNSSTIAIASNLKLLDLSNNIIQLTIPTEIGLLTHLVSMDLSNNALRGSVPSELWSLTKLRGLNLATNDFHDAGMLPGAFSLSSLVELRVSNNILSGSIPTQIGLMTSLESLWLDNTILSGMLPSEVGRLTALTELRLAGNSVVGSIPSEVGSLSKMTSFAVGSNSFTGALPSELCEMSLLQVLDVSNNQLSGVFPTEIGMLSKMTSFNLNGNSFSGTIPSEVGFMVALQHLVLSSNSLKGSIPSALGLVTDLETVHLESNLLAGQLPSEIGLITNLNTLIISDNHNLNGTIPPGLWSLPHLFNLNVAGNQLVGSVPSEIGLMSQMEFFVASDNFLTGSLPSELGQLELLFSLHLSNNPLIGSIPAELETASNLFDLDISGTEIMGSIPDALCNKAKHLEGYYVSSFGDVSQSGKAGSPMVDCDAVVCQCCNCPTPVPSAPPSSTFLPTPAPSISTVPTDSPEPTLAPSRTPEPSISLLPSQTEASCSHFSSIASFGYRLDISGQDDGVEFVQLPFWFNWRGQAQHAVVTVTSNGVVFPGINTNDDGCCTPEPFTILGRYVGSRISVAQADIGPSGYIFTAQVENAFVISWEGVFRVGDSSRNALDFQVLLFEDGDVELRWGEGNPSVGVFAAGLEDEAAGTIVPATGPSFDTAFGAGVSSQWPSNQCRMFVASNGDYTEVMT